MRNQQLNGWPKRAEQIFPHPFNVGLIAYQLAAISIPLAPTQSLLPPAHFYFVFRRQLLDPTIFCWPISSSTQSGIPHQPAISHPITDLAGTRRTRLRASHLFNSSSNPDTPRSRGILGPRPDSHSYTSSASTYQGILAKMGNV